jgi:hypothetical protein
MKDRQGFLSCLRAVNQRIDSMITDDSYPPGRRHKENDNSNGNRIDQGNPVASEHDP